VREGVGKGPTILTVSRLSELYKGHDTAIRLLPLVRAKVPGARYRTAGDGPLREYLARIAGSISLDGAVEFLGDVPDDRLPDLYRLPASPPPTAAPRASASSASRPRPAAFRVCRRCATSSANG
jgi:hypothetical protein